MDEKVVLNKSFLEDKLSELNSLIYKAKKIIEDIRAEIPYEPDRAFMSFPQDMCQCCIHWKDNTYCDLPLEKGCEFKNA